MPSRYEELIATVDALELSKLLPKVLRISQELHDSEFEKWIRLELHGYWDTNPALTNDTIVPKYRTVVGYYTDDYGRPLIIKDHRLAFVNEIRLRFGVVEMEGIIGAQGPLTLMDSGLTDLINKNFEVHVTTFNFYPNQINAVMMAIRTELSDRLISRKSQLSAPREESKINKAEDIIEIKPNFYGVGINARALFKRLQSKGH